MQTRSLTSRWSGSGPDRDAVSGLLHLHRQTASRTPSSQALVSSRFRQPPVQVTAPFLSYKWPWFYAVSLTPLPIQRAHVLSPTHRRSHAIGRAACLTPEPGSRWLQLCPCLAFHFFFWSIEIFILLRDWLYLFNFSLLYFVSCGLKHDLTMPSYQEIPWLPLWS